MVPKIKHVPGIVNISFAYVEGRVSHYGLERSGCFIWLSLHLG